MINPQFRSAAKAYGIHQMVYNDSCLKTEVGYGIVYEVFRGIISIQTRVNSNSERKMSFLKFATIETCTSLSADLSRSFQFKLVEPDDIASGYTKMNCVNCMLGE